MIKLKFNSTKGRLEAYTAMQNVADDVHSHVKYLNQQLNTDRVLPCPSSNDRNAKGLACAAQLWFGKYKESSSVLDISVTDKKTIRLQTSDKWLNKLHQLTALSLCEQFTLVNFTTDEDFTWALKVYGETFGSISKNASKSLGLEEII